MKRKFLQVFFLSTASFMLFSCSNTENEEVKTNDNPAAANNYGGYASMEQWGEHLVTIAGCQDCHTPKIMTPNGPDIDSSRSFSGHPAGSPDLPVDRADIESKGLGVTQDLTAWAGPWGVSYAANLTSDSTGIGGWKEEQFIYAIREGKLKGLPDSRPILPPMPWQMYKHMTDGELKAIFAYLKSTKPIKNNVPPPKPPVTAPR